MNLLILLSLKIQITPAVPIYSTLCCDICGLVVIFRIDLKVASLGTARYFSFKVYHHLSIF